MILDNQMSSALCSALRDGQSIASSNGQAQVEIEHVLLGVLAQEGNVVALLRDINVDVNYVIRRLERESSMLPRALKEGQATLGARLEQALQFGFEQAVSAGRTYAETLDFVSGICRMPSGNAAVMLRSMNLSVLSIQGAATRLNLARETVNTSPSPFSAPVALSAPAQESPYGAFSTPFGRPETPKSFDGTAVQPRPQVVGGVWTPLPTQLVNVQQMTVDWTLMATQGKLRPCLERDNEIRRLIQILMRKTKNNPVLIGENGIGKSTIVMGLAQRIVRGDVPDRFKGTSLLKLDSSTVLGGAKYKSALEESFKKLAQEIASVNGRVILYIPDLFSFDMVSSDLVGILEPRLLRGELLVLTTSNARDQQKIFDEKPNCSRLFHTLTIEEPTAEQAISMLRGIKQIYEVHHGIPISDEAVVAAVNQSRRYLTTRHLPDKAIDLLDESAGRVRMELDAVPEAGEKITARMNEIRLSLSTVQSAGERDALEAELRQKSEEFELFKRQWKAEKDAIAEITSIKSAIERAHEEMDQCRQRNDVQGEQNIRYGKLLDLQSNLKTLETRLNSKPRLVKSSVGPNEIADTVATWTGIPVSKMMEDEVKKILAIEENLTGRVIGQDQAVKAIASAVRRSRTGLQDPNRPIGSFIFLGPSGVGKTELAKSLAAFLFDDEQAIVRLDMSEYMEKHAASKLIGAPPGYVGHEDGGVLTNAVLEKPYSVVLFDEVEKAHPDIFNTLLQLLDDGRLTDSKGQVVDFKNTIIIMTSNLGAKYILEYIRTDPEMMKTKVMEALEGHFRPEFLGRIDGKIIFNALTKEDIRKILGLQMKRIHKLLAGRGLKLELDGAAEDFLVEQGYQPEFGARPIKKAIIDFIQEPLSTLLLTENYPEGTTITATAHEGAEALEFGRK